MRSQKSVSTGNSPHNFRRIGDGLKKWPLYFEKALGVLKTNKYMSQYIKFHTKFVTRVSIWSVWSFKRNLIIHHYLNPSKKYKNLQNEPKKIQKRKKHWCTCKLNMNPCLSTWQLFVVCFIFAIVTWSLTL
jgi:hypothetical protein